MAEYRIVTNGRRYRAQRRWRFLLWEWWWTTGLWWAKDEFVCLEFAKEQMGALKQLDDDRRAPWVTVEKGASSGDTGQDTGVASG
jgi:hypothetical protein